MLGPTVKLQVRQRLFFRAWTRAGWVAGLNPAMVKEGDNGA